MKSVTLVIIKIYKYLISPFMEYLFGKKECKFNPTCSNFAYQSIEKYGFYKGGKMAIVRLSKCHPF